MNRRTVTAALLLSFIQPLSAQYPAWLPEGLSAFPGGVLMRGTDAVTGLAPGGGATVTAVDVAGQPFTRALRVDIASAPQNSWDVNLRIRTARAVAQNDVMLLVFWARAVRGQPETAEGWIGALFEKAAADWDKSLSIDVAPGTSWKQFVFPFACSQAYDSAASHWGFNFGALSQTVEIGGVELVWFGTSVTLDQLRPLQTRITYSGSALDAPWRAEAAARIERLRMAGLSVTILDNGQPAPGAQVRARMTRHAFGFGTAVDAGRITPGSETVYMEKIRLNFNKAVIENHLKWRYWSAESEQTARTAVDWLNGWGIAVRGHVLVWPSWRNMPESVSHDSSTLAGQIVDHITRAVTMYKGDLVEWDVINEPYDNHDAMDLLGNRAMVDWFDAARRADSSAILYINDYAILAGNDAAHRDHYDATIRYLLDQGAPLMGIGMQGHFGQTPIAPDEVLRRLDRFAAFGLPIQVTEFDVNTTDEQLQADYTRDFLTAVFSHEAVRGFLMWGFWAGAHWLPDGAMYRLDWSEKPNLAAWRGLVYGQWWTDTSAVADTQGTCRVRGFKGAYDIAVTIGGVTRIFPVVLDSDAAVTCDFALGTVSARSVPRQSGAPAAGLTVRTGRRSGVQLEVCAGRTDAWVLVLHDAAGRVLRRSAGHGSAMVPVTVPGLCIARLHHAGGETVLTVPGTTAVRR